MLKTTIKITGMGLMLLVGGLLGCQQEPEDLAAAERPILAELAPEVRSLQRRLPLEGAENFRDLGGYRTHDGRQLRWGMIYRADTLHHLSDEDLRYLERLGLKQVVDFRTADERSHEPDRLPAGVIYETREILVEGAVMSEMKSRIADGSLDELDLPNLLVRGNEAFVLEHSQTYRDWLHSLLDTQALPQVFHCTAGKDRTGFAAAVLLLALGVPERTVMADYLATNDYVMEQAEQRAQWAQWLSLGRLSAEDLMPLLRVEARYLEAAFRAIEREYGSVERYLSEGLDLDEQERARLQSIFLEHPLDGTKN